MNIESLRCAECGPHPEDDVTRCIRCMAADEIERLTAEGTRYREALNKIQFIGSAKIMLIAIEALKVR